MTRPQPQPRRWSWFAWRPVRTLDRGWVWLQPVWRQRMPPSEPDGAWTWENWVWSPAPPRARGEVWEDDFRC